MLDDHPLRAGLPELPSRMARLPVDARGFPVPWFVAWVDGVPDHRIIDKPKLARAIKHGHCWLCGEPLGRNKTFVLGPMCAVNRTVSEPPSHRACAVFAVRACPFLSRPHAHRRDAGLPEEVQEPGGVGLKRNPGATCLWTTERYHVWRVPGDAHSHPGVLFRIGEPLATEWWTAGRWATRAEVDAAVAAGLPTLQELARAQDAEEHSTGACRQLKRQLEAFAAVLAQAFPEPVEVTHDAPADH